MTGDEDARPLSRRLIENHIAAIRQRDGKPKKQWSPHPVIARDAPHTIEALRDILAKGRKMPRAGLKPEPIVLRTLEVAINAAELEDLAHLQAPPEKRGPRDAREYRLAGWKQQQALSRRVEQALSALIDHLASPPGGDDDGKGWATLHQARLGSSGLDWPSLRREAKADWATLKRANEIVKRLTEDTGRRHKSLTADRREGNPARNAFVRTFAEGWTFLFGKPPSQTPDARNPFLRVVAAGMADWKGSAEVEAQSDGEGYWLAQPLKMALRDIEGRATMLATDGPSWLRR